MAVKRGRPIKRVHRPSVPGAASPSQPPLKKAPLAPGTVSVAAPEPKKTRIRKKKDPYQATKKDFAGKEKSTTNQDIMWVYTNMSVSDMKPSDAPSAGAWDIWVRCREPEFATSIFYRTLLPKTIPTQAAIDRGAVSEMQDTKVQASIQRLLLDLKEEAEGTAVMGGVQ